MISLLSLAEAIKDLSKCRHDHYQSLSAIINHYHCESLTEACIFDVTLYPSFFKKFVFWRLKCSDSNNLFHLLWHHFCR